MGIFDFFKTKKPEKIAVSKPFDLLDFISPPSIHLKPKEIVLEEEFFCRSYLIFSYPRYLTEVWVADLINLWIPMDISIHIFPVPTGEVLKKLEKKLTEIEAEIAEREKKGLIRDPELEAAHQDIEDLRTRLQTAQEKMFRVGVYFTIYAKNPHELERQELQIRETLEGKLIYPKPALFQQKEGLNSCLPYGLDQLETTFLLNTGPLSTFFPFVSADLSANEGILYGINRHNNSLVLFDRFTLPNANAVVFGVSGSGKSYAVKLEILRYLMQGVDVIVIDPENEYKRLAEAVGGTFLDLSLTSPTKLNPFDLPPVGEDESPKDVLKENILNLIGLLRLMFGGLSSEEESILDVALTQVYAARDITPETDPSTWSKNVPIMEDLEQVLEGIEGAEVLARKIKRFTKGTYAEFFNQRTNVKLGKHLVVFGIRNLEEELRPLAMYIAMKFIWNEVRKTLRKRILVVDEAWWMMKEKDSAEFLFGLVKRGRKYWLGVTTITQDVNDFMKSPYGQPIITNSSLVLLMKQSPATIDIVQKTFRLTESERLFLLETDVGNGLFFAGLKHIALKIISSYFEDQIITTSPAELLKIKQKKKLEEEG